MQTQYLQRMLIGVGLVLTMAAPRASATDYYVTTNGTGDGTLSWANASSNLIGVVAATLAGDTVYVTNNAKYYLTNQIIVSYPITVRSWGPNGIVDSTNTIIDANYPGTTMTNRHFRITNSGVLAGFTLTNGWGSSNSNTADGGSIYLQSGIVTNCIIMRNYALNTNPSWSVHGGGGIFMGGMGSDVPGSGGVWNCTISGNSVKEDGGGICIKSGGGPWRVANCTFSGNSSVVGQGGGISAESATANTIISNCWFISNQGGYSGGAMLLSGAAECHNSFIISNKAVSSPSSFGGAARLSNIALLRNCLIVNNSALASSGYAGGVYINADVSIQNCTIASNVATGSGGVFFMGTGGNAGHPKVENTIIWGNSGSVSNWSSGATNSTESWVTFTNCCIAPNIYSNGSSFASGINTVTNDPRFVSAAIRDFRLQSDSPCINAGVNRAGMEGAWDFYGNRRIDNFRKVVDIGACEYLSKGTLLSGH